MIYLKTHDTENGTILAMCDSALIERVLTEGDLEINIKDYSEFYRGQLVDRDSAKKAIKKEALSSANIVGEESIEVALDAGIIEKDGVKRIMNVPYANSFRMK